MNSLRQLLGSLMLVGSLNNPAFAEPAVSGEAEFSSLKITVNPANAKLLIDDKPVALVEGVAEFAKIPSGIHKVSVAHPDYVDKADDITLLPNKLAVLTVQLEGKPSRIDIKSRPGAAAVLLDEKLASYYGATTDSTPLTLTLPAGRYVLNLKKETYKTYQDALVVLPNRPQKVVVQLSQPNEFSQYLNWIGGTLALSGAVVAVYGSVQDEKRIRNTGWGVAIGGLGIAFSSVILD